MDTVSFRTVGGTSVSPHIVDVQAPAELVAITHQLSLVLDRTLRLSWIAFAGNTILALVVCYFWYTRDRSTRFLDSRRGAPEGSSTPEEPPLSPNLSSKSEFLSASGSTAAPSIYSSVGAGSVFDLTEADDVGTYQPTRRTKRLP